MRAITRGFGMLGGGALALLVVTGLWNYRVASDEGALDYRRYFFALQFKLLLVVILIILTALHAMVFGRQLQRLQESDAPEAAIAAARGRSMLVSVATLVVSIVILLLAAIRVRRGRGWAGRADVLDTVGEVI